MADSPLPLPSEADNNPPAQQPGRDGTPEPTVNDMRTRTNLPAPLTTLIGRTSELTEILARLAEPACRLLTLIGLGGVGKTQLAIAAANAIQQEPTQATQFADGIVFVALGEMTEIEQLPSVLAAALEFRFESNVDTLTQLSSFLRSRRLLLVLDQFDLPEDYLTILVSILEAAPHVKCLVTARARLNLAEEWVLEIKGLPFEPAEAATSLTSAAAQLFVQRAQAVMPEFQPARDALAINTICRHLHGLPLGIILAANTIRIYPCRRIAERLQQDSEFLATDASDLPNRHRSLRTVFEQSWQMLTPVEQQLFAQLSIFAGEFATTAVMTILGHNAVDLSNLVDKSLLQRQQVNDPDADYRYRLHPLLHQFAQEKLDPTLAQPLAQRHASYYLHLLADQQSRLSGSQARQSLALIQAKLSNIRKAWQWATETKQLALLDVGLTGLAAFYLLQGPLAELEKLLQNTLEQLRPLAESPNSTEQQPAQQLVSLFLGTLSLAHNERGAYAEARTLAQAAIDHAQASQQRVGEANGYLQLGRAHFFQGRYPEAQQVLNKARQLAQQGRFLPILAASHVTLGATLLYGGKYSDGQAHYEEALRLYTALGDEANVLKLHYNMALVLFYNGDYLPALATFTDCLARARTLQDERSIALLLNNLGALYTQIGDYPQAKQHYQEALDLKRPRGDQSYESLILANLGLLAVYEQQFQRALGHCRAALALSQKLGEPSTIAFAQTCFGDALVGLGWSAEAATMYNEALAIRRQLKQEYQQLEPLAGLATVYLALDQPQQALGYAEQILPYLPHILATGITGLFRIFWSCYQVLDANRDLRALGVLDTAYAALQERAARLTDPVIRHSYLENVVIHKAIVKAHSQTAPERRNEGGEDWRRRMELHSDLFEDLRSLLRSDEDEEQ